MTLKEIAQELANQGGMPYAWEDTMYRLQKRLPLAFTIPDGEWKIVEFCYEWLDSRRIETRYTREYGSKEALDLQLEIDHLRAEFGTDECPFPYFYRFKK